MHPGTLSPVNDIRFNTLLGSIAFIVALGGTDAIEFPQRLNSLELVYSLYALYPGYGALHASPHLANFSSCILWPINVKVILEGIL